MRVNHIFLQGWMICLWIIWVLWGCQTHWDGEGWGNGRRGKLSILSGMSGCLIKGVMTERSAGERKTFWEHTQVWGICKGFWIKTNRKNLICQQLPVFDPLVILSMSGFFFRAAGLYQKAQHQLPRLRWVRGVHVCTCLCVSQRDMNMKLSQWNAMEESLFLDWHADCVQSSQNDSQ